MKGTPSLSIDEVIQPSIDGVLKGIDGHSTEIGPSVLQPFHNLVQIITFRLKDHRMKKAD